MRVPIESRTAWPGRIGSIPASSASGHAPTRPSRRGCPHPEMRWPRRAEGPGRGEWRPGQGLTRCGSPPENVAGTTCRRRSSSRSRANFAVTLGARKNCGRGSRGRRGRARPAGLSAWRTFSETGDATPPDRGWRPPSLCGKHAGRTEHGLPSPGGIPTCRCSPGDQPLGHVAVHDGRPCRLPACLDQDRHAPGVSRGSTASAAVARAAGPGDGGAGRGCLGSAACPQRHRVGWRAGLAHRGKLSGLRAIPYA